jgi:hypothetical protein
VWPPALAVGATYLALMAVFVLRHHYAALSFVHLGTVWTEHDPQGGWGYDGQFSYQLAKDPLGASQFMDNAAFRSQRIVYPLVVYALARGQRVLVPYVLLAVGWLAVVASVTLLASQLRRHGLSPWYSLAYGLYFGVAIGFTFDLAEPLMGALVALGIWLHAVWDAPERRRVLAAAAIFGLAALTRETAALFPLAYAAHAAWGRDWRATAWLVGLGVLPLLLWIVVLRLTFGECRPAFTPPLERLPFYGLFVHRAAPGLFALDLVLVLVPTCAAAFALWALVRRARDPLLLAWLGSLALVVTLNRYCYQELPSTGRIANAAVLAALAYAAVHHRRLCWGLLYYAATFAIYGAGVWLGIRSLIV